MKRRESLKLISAATASMLATSFGCQPPENKTRVSGKRADFRFCLNTSTIQGNKLGLKKSIETASRAGFDGVELWIMDVKACINDGNSLSSLNQLIRQSGLVVENAIGFAPWLADDEETSRNGFQQMREEMELMAAIGCQRIAAPAAGHFIRQELDLFRAGEKYRQLITLGRETGVMPQLEFWGSSKVLYHIGQTLMIAAVANDAGARLLPDVYHMFRGGSGFETLQMLHGNMVEVFHVNDYPGNIPREKQTDQDRVYPGDGIAPLNTVIESLHRMGGTKILSLELFNQDYWLKDPFLVAKTGLQKMRSMVGK